MKPLIGQSTRLDSWGACLAKVFGWTDEAIDWPNPKAIGMKPLFHQALDCQSPDWMKPLAELVKPIFWLKPGAGVEKPLAVLVKPQIDQISLWTWWKSWLDEAHGWTGKAPNWTGEALDWTGHAPDWPKPLAGLVKPQATKLKCLIGQAPLLNWWPSWMNEGWISIAPD